MKDTPITKMFEDHEIKSEIEADFSEKNYHRIHHSALYGSILYAIMILGDIINFKTENSLFIWYITIHSLTFIFLLINFLFLNTKKEKIVNKNYIFCCCILIILFIIPITLLKQESPNDFSAYTVMIFVISTFFLQSFARIILLNALAFVILFTLFPILIKPPFSSLQHYIANVLFISTFAVILGYNVNKSIYESVFKEIINMKIIKNSFDIFIRKYNITEREKVIISNIIKGDSNKLIADKLQINLQTVKSHIYNIFRKTGAKSRIELLNLINSV